MNELDVHRLLLAALLAAATIALVGLLLRARVRPRWFLALALAPVVALELDSAWRDVSYHGLMHASIVYELFERGAPPENPLLAGEALRYPYAHHFLIASAMRVLPFAPPVFFAATNLVGLVLYLGLVDRIAQQFAADRVARVYAGLLALTGTSPLCIGPARAWLADLAWPPDRRVVPLTKFTTVNSNQIGLVCFALTVFGLVELLRAGGSRRRGFVSLSVGIAGAGVLYPYVAASAGLCVGVVALGTASAAPAGAAARRAALWVLAAAATGTAVAAPFLLAMLGAGEPSGDGGVASTFRLAPTRADLLRNAWDLGLALILPAVLFAVRRDVLARLWREHRTPLAALLAAAAIHALLFLVLQITDWRAQYKFAALAMILVAVPLAFVLGAIHARRSAAALALALVFVLPAAHWCADILADGWAVTDPVRASGRYLEHEDQAQRELFAWIAARTEADAVLLDTNLGAPALARRPLLVGPNRAPADERSGSDGWGNGPDMLYDTQPALVAHRRQLAAPLFGERGFQRARPDLGKLAQAAGGRPLYVVARTAPARASLEADEQAARVFSNAAGDVYSIVREARR